MNNIKIIIGLHTSMEFLNEAREDKSLLVYAFEPNKNLVEVIYKKFKLPSNYKIINKAVSNFNGNSTFYICSDDSCSSLNNWGNGPKLGEMKETIVECVRMDDFIEENNIKNIQFLLIDTQGNDLNVLKGFGDKIKIVRQGMCESLSEDTEWKLYQNQPSFSEFISFFDENGFNTEWNFNKGGAIETNEVNIKFKKLSLI
jgi:FkbM family methyltransferase